MTRILVSVQSASSVHPKERDLIRGLQAPWTCIGHLCQGKSRRAIFSRTRRRGQPFGKGIDVQKRIIQPVLAERAAGYGLNLPNLPDWKERLARLAPSRKRRPRA